MVNYHKGKCYFNENVQGQTIKARTACLILRYKNLDGEWNVLTILESIEKNILEFPGGKVEANDLNLADTLLRECWEEIVLKDDFGASAALKNWRDIHDKILIDKDTDSMMFKWMESQISKSITVTYGTCPLRTVYYIVDITKRQAEYFIDQHSMIPIPIEFMKTIVQFNKKTKERTKRFTRRTTYFHVNGVDYRLRGRDFEGMFRYLPTLEKPAIRQIDWSLCRTPTPFTKTATIEVQ